MISIFGNEPGSPDPQAANQLHVAPQSASRPQAAHPAAQHPAVSRTVVTPPAASSAALAPRYTNTHSAAPVPAPEKHGIFSWLSIGKTKKRLQMLETVSLGEKRFVALVQVDGRQFLIGGAPSNVGMIAELAPEETFHQVLRDATEGLNEAPTAQSPAPVLAAPAPVAMPAPIAAVTPAPLFSQAAAVVRQETPAPLAPITAAPVTAIPANVHVMAAPAPVTAAPVMMAPLPVEPPTTVSMPSTEPVAAPAPVQYMSIAPLSLAEAAPSASVIAAPAAKPKGPSLPPHVAARLAELQAAAQVEQAKPEHSILPDDLSLEEPVSFSPSLLAAMQQRARAALLNDQAPAAPAFPVHAQEAAPQAILPVAQAAPAAPATAPSFTFQFTPMLTSTIQAVRVPGSAMKLQGGSLVKMPNRIRVAILACLLCGALAANASAQHSGSAESLNAAVSTSSSALLAPMAAAILQSSHIGPITATPNPSNPNELKVTGFGGGSTQWTIVVLLTFLTLIPSILICMTPFARLLIVFHFLRQALGLQTTPSNQTLVGLSMIMTFFLMQPVGKNIYENAIVPLQDGKLNAMQALDAGSVPIRGFMVHYVRDKDVAMFLDIAKEPRPARIDDLSFRVLLPAYILSELKSGFQIGAVLFLPFLVVDMVVASITTTVGMMQLPPVVISTPLKLLLFLMVDGWHLLVGALMRSFN